MGERMAEWELSKENVEPIKEGRNMNSLKAALTLTNNQNNYHFRETTRKEFEAELRTYSGPDPLSVYHKYIQWIEQNYPEGGNEAKLKTVLEKCIEQFYSSDQYRNDSRLMTIFLKFIKRVDSPLELFNYFHENGFGTELSEFYINWSFHLENHKNTKRAVEVLRLGLEKRAEPKASLLRAKEQLEIRVAKAIANGLVDELNENDGTEEQTRKPLNKLKEKTKKGKSEAPVKRVGNAVKNTKSGLKSSEQKSQNSNKVPVIYSDENDANIQVKTVQKPEASSHVKHISSVGQENEQKPGKWSENKIKQKSIKTNAKPTFAIHADDSDDEQTNVFKPPQSNALKVRARNAESPPIARFEKPDPLKKFMFNEKKLYAGGEEFSFEEIRGRKWLSAKRKEEELLRNQKLEEEVAQLRKQVELLLNSQQNKVIKESESVSNPVIEQSKESSSPQASSADSSNAKSVSNGNVSKGTLSMMRELCWNGTLANNEMPENVPKLDMNEKECKTNENFLIYSDRTILSTSNQRNEKASKPRYSLNETGYTNEAFTIALPKSEDDFIATCFSTPMADKSKKIINNIDIAVTQHNNVNFVGGMTAKLSPIVETSREYNSKSSSSSSGTMSSAGVSAISRRQRAFSGVENIDPFDIIILTQLMESLPEPIDSRKGFFRVKKALPKIKRRETTLKLGNDHYLIDSLIATGAYAHVYSAQIDDTSDSYDTEDSTNCSGLSKIVSQKWFALKISKPANPWEFYICDELHKRLNRSKQLPDIELSVMSANPSVMFKDASVLVDELVPYGTLINVMNICKKQDKTFPKSLIAYYSLELIQIVQQIHKCQIIHADMKPDNVLILNFPMREDVNNVSKRTTSLKVIDFGRSIDMQILGEGTTFNISVQTKGSQCCEMLDSKPWTYQTDWFGVLDCIHVMLFGDYIKVRKNKANKWEIVEKFKRYHQTDIWEPLFETLLNIPDCHEMPDLSEYIESLNEYVKQNINQIVKDANDLEIMNDSATKKRK